KRFISSSRSYQFNLKSLKDSDTFLLRGRGIDLLPETEKTYEHIYLPLYSTRTMAVSVGSGLNQWNAKGRTRHEDEVYIPIPIWIHRSFPDFFTYDLNAYQDAKRNGRSYESVPFTLEIPNGTEFSAKICQENGKALMTNPIRHLGNWLLRHVLQIPSDTLVTYQMLEDVGIDSVVVT